MAKCKVCGKKTTLKTPEELNYLLRPAEICEVHGVVATEPDKEMNKSKGAQK